MGWTGTNHSLLGSAPSTHWQKFGHWLYCNFVQSGGDHPPPLHHPVTGLVLITVKNRLRLREGACVRREGIRCEKTEAPIEKPIAAPCSTPLSAPVSPVHPEAPLAFVRKSPCESGLARARSTGRCTLGRLFGLRVAARPPFLHCSLARATLVDARRTSRYAAASCRRVDVELANLRPWPE